MTAMLRIDDLHVDYGPVHAVRGLNLVVEEAETHGLLGANGAGKSSTLRAISGLIPYRGRVEFDGADCRKLGVDGIVRAGLIHVLEGRRLFSQLSVHENLQVGLTARHGRHPTYSLADVYDLFPPLARIRERSAWALSGGEQQMVALGRALVAAPRMLLLDEPSLGLAPVVTKAVYRVLEEIGKTIPLLIVEQQTAVSLPICDRATIMATGKVVLEGAPEELRDREKLIESFLGRRSHHLAATHPA